MVSGFCDVFFDNILYFPQKAIDTTVRLAGNHRRLLITDYDIPSNYDLEAETFLPARVEHLRWQCFFASLAFFVSHEHAQTLQYTLHPTLHPPHKNQICNLNLGICIIVEP